VVNGADMRDETSLQACQCPVRRAAAGEWRSNRAKRPHLIIPIPQGAERSCCETEDSACRGEQRRGAGSRPKGRAPNVQRVGKESVANSHPQSLSTPGAARSRGCSVLSGPQGGPTHPPTTLNPLSGSLPAHPEGFSPSAHRITFAACSSTCPPARSSARDPGASARPPPFPARRDKRPRQPTARPIRTPGADAQDTSLPQ